MRIVAPDTLEWPDYDGNSMYRSLGNMAASPTVGILFMPFDGRSTRLRVNGRAELLFGEADLARHHGAGNAVVRVRATHIFRDCPRYIPAMTLVEPSVYSPRPGHQPPDPEWKGRDHVRDILPRPRR